MRYGLTLFLFAILAGSLALSQSNTATSNTTPKKQSQAVPGKSVPAKKKTASPSSAAKKTSASKKSLAAKKGKSAKKPAAVAYRQMAPAPERYREIQEALAGKGYLKSEPNGVWDDQSAEALRQFQTDQKLSPTGKLSSASLIALGLGPKTTSSSSAQPPLTPIEAPPPNTHGPTPEN